MENISNNTRNFSSNFAANNNPTPDLNENVSKTPTKERFGSRILHSIRSSKVFSFALTTILICDIAVLLASCFIPAIPTFLFAGAVCAIPLLLVSLLFSFTFSEKCPKNGDNQKSDPAAAVNRRNDAYNSDNGRVSNNDKIKISKNRDKFFEQFDNQPSSFPPSPPDTPDQITPPRIKSKTFQNEIGKEDLNLYLSPVDVHMDKVLGRYRDIPNKGQGNCCFIALNQGLNSGPVEDEDKAWKKERASLKKFGKNLLKAYFFPEENNNLINPSSLAKKFFKSSASDWDIDSDYDAMFHSLIDDDYLDLKADCKPMDVVKYFSENDENQNFKHGKKNLGRKAASSIASLIEKKYLSSNPSGPDHFEKPLRDSLMNEVINCLKFANLYKEPKDSFKDKFKEILRTNIEIYFPFLAPAIFSPLKDVKFNEKIDWALTLVEQFYGYSNDYKPLAMYHIFDAYLQNEIGYMNASDNVKNNINKGRHRGYGNNTDIRLFAFKHPDKVVIIQTGSDSARNITFLSPLSTLKNKFPEVKEVKRKSGDKSEPTAADYRNYFFPPDGKQDENRHKELLNENPIILYRDGLENHWNYRQMLDNAPALETANLDKIDPSTRVTLDEFVKLIVFGYNDSSKPPKIGTSSTVLKDWTSRLGKIWTSFFDRFLRETGLIHLTNNDNWKNVSPDDLQKLNDKIKNSTPDERDFFFPVGNSKLEFFRNNKEQRFGDALQNLVRILTTTTTDRNGNKKLKIDYNSTALSFLRLACGNNITPEEALQNPEKVDFIRYLIDLNEKVNGKN